MSAAGSVTGSQEATGPTQALGSGPPALTVDQLIAVLHPFATIGKDIRPTSIRRGDDGEERPAGIIEGKPIFASDLMRAAEIVFANGADAPAILNAFYIARSRVHEGKVAVFNEEHACVADEFLDRRAAERWIDYQRKTGGSK